MKQIILYAALVTGAAGIAVLGYRNVQKNAVIGGQERTIAEQRAMIERLPRLCPRIPYQLPHPCSDGDFNGTACTSLKRKPVKQLNRKYLKTFCIYSGSSPAL